MYEFTPRLFDFDFDEFVLRLRHDTAGFIVSAVRFDNATRQTRFLERIRECLYIHRYI